MIILKKLNKSIINELKKDSVFKNRMSNEINQIIDFEMSKSDDEIDWELIDECTDSLLFLNNMENDDLRITPFLIKKYRTKYVISNIFKVTSGLAAAIALVIIAWGIVSNQSQPNLLKEVDVVTTTAPQIIKAEEPTTEAELTTAPTENEFVEDNTSTTKQNLQTTQNISKVQTTKSNNEVTDVQTTHIITQVSTTQKQERPTEKPTTSHQEFTTQQTTVPTTIVIENEKNLNSVSGEYGKGFKTVYFVGEELDLFGLSVVAHYDDGTTAVINNAKCSFNGFSSNSVGNKTVIVSYEGKSFTFNVKVVSRG